MRGNARSRGHADAGELTQAPGYPSADEMSRGPLAVIECVDEIPCNPCEAACPQGAIVIGSALTNLPRLLAERCTGCGTCVAACPGLAIFVVDKTASSRAATVTMPWEFLPAPDRGDRVDLVDRSGQVVGRGRVVRTRTAESLDRTALVTVEVPFELADSVRAIRT